MTVTTADGHVIVRNAADPVSLSGKAFTLREEAPQGESYYALGDKTGSSADRRGRTFVNWNTDAFGFSSSDDPIYKSIPFFIGVGGDSGSYGLFLDNTFRASFDFAHVDPATLSFGAPDGPIDYYLIAGPSTSQVVRRYTDLTGRAPLPPLWALGYQQSRYSYMSANEVRQIADHLRADKMPTDVIWLDIDYQDRNRPFTTDPATFPDLTGLVKDVGRQGIKLIAITDLHVADLPNQNYAPYDSGTAGNHFVHRPDGGVYVAPVWPGPSLFPDFTDVSARRWWGTLFRPLLDDGVAGFWNDMNEPAVFATPTKTMPLDIVHRVNGDGFAPRTALHTEIHNVYGMENSRATFDGLKALRSDERPFVMTRASYAGGQRYAVTWTGDNSATWDHLRLSVHQLTNLGLSGFAYSAADVGGFAGGPSPELLTRWFEIATFTPVFRDHAAKGTPRAEPWVDGPAQLDIRRHYVNERYRLLPYIYALADQSARLGDPLMRPLFYDFPGAIHSSCNQDLAFTLGGRLLVAPSPNPESPQPYDVCLPAGGWYDYWTGLVVPGQATAATNAPIQSATQAAAVAPAQAELKVHEVPRLDVLPVFVRAGTILPRQPLIQSTSQTPVGPLELDVYPGDDCTGVLYLDDGHSLGYTRGDFLRQGLRCTVTREGLALHFLSREGRYAPWWHSIAVTVHGWAGPGRVASGQDPVDAKSSAGDQLHFTLPDMAGERTVTITRK
jgi:alpha-glucosidase